MTRRTGIVLALIILGIIGYLLIQANNNRQAKELCQLGNSIQAMDEHPTNGAQRDSLTRQLDANENCR